MSDKQYLTVTIEKEIPHPSGDYRRVTLFTYSGQIDKDKLLWSIMNGLKETKDGE